MLQGRDAGRHGQRVAGKRAGLVDTAGRGKLLHDLVFAAEGSHRQAAADDLAQGGHVRGHAVQFLGPAVGHPEAGHDLIEDQDDPLLACRARAAPPGNPSRGGTVPMFPATGSTMMQAIGSLFSATSLLTESSELYSAVRVAWRSRPVHRGSREPRRWRLRSRP